jgi:hypothetical protein
MQLCFFSGRVIRAFLIVASLSYASTAFSQTNGDNSSADGPLEDRCESSWHNKNPLKRNWLDEIQDAEAWFRVISNDPRMLGPKDDAVREAKWNKMLVFKQNPSMQTPTCKRLINVFFYRAIKQLDKERDKKLKDGNPFSSINYEKKTQMQ